MGTIRRSHRRHLVLDCLLVAAVVSLAVLWLTHQRGVAVRRASSTHPVATTGVAESPFDRDLRRSLSPMLTHVRQLPAVLKNLGNGTGKTSDSLAALTAQWVESRATARDLVGRLAPPAGRLGPEIKELDVTATMLQLEAARAASQATKDATAAAETARSGSRLLLLGDRTFDLARRLSLPGDGASKLVFPREAPDFAKEGLDPDHPAAAADGRSGFQSDGPTVPVKHWLGQHRDAVDEARRVMTATASAYGQDAIRPEPAVPAARRLEASAASLGDLLPAEGTAREGVTALRLGLLTTAESLRTLGGSGVDHLTSATRLRLIGERLWASGAKLLGHSGAAKTNQLRTASSGLDPELLLVGGVFGGHPPALQPDEDVGAGVPGGLPEINQRIS